ncbi:DNA primase [candidate division WWE3 bacterium]|uniref:DNA primase n=1 Tax=candidate division WWE3 bacterium TaxID=2053526 RepID=A0A7X9DL41_UNCKA|nr:DNA primase [candidate division WWE3 bacterium]
MDAVSQIKQKLDIVDVISSYITLKKTGKNYQAICPFHSENTPSFNVSPDLQIFKCFGCGESGDMISFVEKIEGIEFPDALKILADKAGVTLEKTDFDGNSRLKQRLFYINELTARFYNYLLKSHSLGRPGLDYLTQKRKLAMATIDSFMLGYAPSSGNILLEFLKQKGVSTDEMLQAGVIVTRSDNGDFSDKFRGRVIFPLMAVDGKVVGFSGRTIFDYKPKYLNTSETLIFHKGNFVYALNKAKLAVKKEGAVLVEGNMDVIAAHQNNIENVIAASGTAVTVAQLQLISRYTKDIVLSLDADSAGINAAFRAVDLAEKLDFNIKVCVTPAGYKDLDELVRSAPEEAAGMIRSAIPAYDFFITASTKLHDKNTPEGKKKIMEDLMPKFSRIQNKVLLDHYSGEIAKQLELDKNTVFNLLSEKKPLSEVSIKYDATPQVLVENNEKPEMRTEMYYMALLLKLPYDKLKNKLSALKYTDFIDQEAQDLYGVLGAYVDSKHSFNIQDFFSFVEKPVRNLVQDLYLSGMQYDEASVDTFIREVDTLANRIKVDGVKRALKLLTEKIKLAEKENNDKLIAELTVQFNQLSKELKI